MASTALYERHIGTLQWELLDGDDPLLFIPGEDLGDAVIWRDSTGVHAKDYVFEEVSPSEVRRLLHLPAASPLVLCLHTE